jgi:hypothetical protein
MQERAYFQGLGFDLPDVPTGWTDTSWGNEGAASYTLGIYRAWIDHPDPKEREPFEGGPRFMVQTEAGGPTLIESDDWATVVRFVWRQHAADLYAALHGAVSALYLAYDQSSGSDALGADLNDLQPSSAPGVLAMSLDEWACEFPGVIADWRALADKDAAKPETSNV